ncbi:MAG: hypothetical protein ACD_20C00162G0009 [uncultured bacterium]|nr:MAG: hypothetical protein ACD_20C00162G0009 [uncultured bacterium]
MLESILASFNNHPEFNASVGAGLLIFARLIGFVVVAPVLGRKDVPVLIKVSFAFLMTLTFFGILSPGKPPPETSPLLSITLNTVFGLLIGYIASLIFATISAAGNMSNAQMGLSSVQMFDPSSKEQSSAMGNLFAFIATIIFINIGGLYWIISALHRSFDIFPLYGTSIPLQQIINVEYLTLLSGNVLFIGLQVASPILIATLGMDIILGIISKVAPQVNVFQLSFLFKPMIGAAIIIIILPLLINIISDYFLQYSRIY